MIPVKTNNAEVLLLFKFETYGLVDRFYILSYYSSSTKIEVIVAFSRYIVIRPNLKHLNIK